jgi:hypothetical protein
VQPGAPPPETGPAAVIAACLPADLRGTDHGRAFALWAADVGEAVIALAGGRRVA